MAGIALIIVGFILLQVRNQNKLLQQQKALAAAELEHQKKLLQAEITSQENERQRIGKDLHDEVGSVLSSLRLMIEHHTENDEPAGEKTNFNSNSKKMIDDIINNVRHISHNLSPRISGSFGFYDAVHELCETVKQSGGITLTLQFTEDNMPVHFDSNTAMATYRVIAELINNTIKHAKATSIYLTITTEKNNVLINYTDNGSGFLYNKNGAYKGMGLQNIESRLSMINASWQIITAPSEGFIMHISILSN